MRRQLASGLSFVELLLIVAMLGIVSLVVLPTLLTLDRRLDEERLRRSLAQIRAALDEYHEDWVHGYIEGSTDTGWPESLEELTEEIEYTGPEGRPPEDPLDDRISGSNPSDATDLNHNLPGQALEPIPKIYLPRIPPDPFNVRDDPNDTGGWCALSYEDEHDDTTWGGEDVYDVRSCAPWTALDGTKYEEW